MKFNLRQRLQTIAKNGSLMKHLAAILFFMLFIYCKTTSNTLISTFLNKLMIKDHPLCYFCEIVGHFGFYLPKNPPMKIQSKQIMCDCRPYTRQWYKNILVRNLF